MKILVTLKSAKSYGCLHEDHHTFLIISLSLSFSLSLSLSLSHFFSEWEIFGTDFVENIEKQILCSIFFFLNCAIYGIWTNIVEPERPQIFEKVVEHEMYVVIFSTSFVCNFSHSKKNWAGYCHKCPKVFLLIIRYSCQILMKLDFSRHVLEKISNVRFLEDPFIGCRVVPCS